MLAASPGQPESSRLPFWSVKQCPALSQITKTDSGRGYTGSWPAADLRIGSDHFSPRDRCVSSSQEPGAVKQWQARPKLGPIQRPRRSPSLGAAAKAQWLDIYQRACLCPSIIGLRFGTHVFDCRFLHSSISFASWPKTSLVRDMITGSSMWAEDRADAN